MQCPTVQYNLNPPGAQWIQSNGTSVTAAGCTTSPQQNHISTAPYHNVQQHHHHMVPLTHPPPPICTNQQQKQFTHNNDPLIEITNLTRQWQPLQVKEQVSPVDELYSKKVFVGGLPPDIDEGGLVRAFGQFGTVRVDWPHKGQNGYQFPPQGYAFVIYDKASSVPRLLQKCTEERGQKYFLSLSSLTIKNKPVQIRPWYVGDGEFSTGHRQGNQGITVDRRNTVFVGGVPRPTTAEQLCMAFELKFGGVWSVSVDVDTDTKYPKGAARVTFLSRQSYVTAIAARFIVIRTTDGIDKQMEVKPFVLDSAPCDGCEATTRHFCTNIRCLVYLCNDCWPSIHYGANACHKPMMRGGAVNGANANGEKRVMHKNHHHHHHSGGNKHF